MTQSKTIFTCSKCDAQSPKWSGKCLECGSWGTLSESIKQETKNNKQILPKASPDKVVKFGSIKIKDEDRVKTNIGELDRVFGGGIVEGSLTLLGGEPGIGKSTLVLQLADKIGVDLLYASGEESANQVKLRVDRLGFKLNNLSFIAENNVEQIIAHILEQRPKLAIIDSIQTLYSSQLPNEAGGINQVRACTVKLLEVAKQNNISMIIIGHVTKEGTVAGPKTLEHLVDTVLYLEGSKRDAYRILRPIKNRFGSTDELGIFEMTSKGLIDVSDPSNLFYSPADLQQSGTVATLLLEGGRPFVVEIQALVTKTQFGYPQRKASGFDPNRLQMLIAVLMKRAGLKLEAYDVHLNVVGGFKINETAADLAVCMALESSLKDRVPKSRIIAFGEVGLGGEVRPVPQMQRRIDEAKRMGFDVVQAKSLKELFS